MSRLSSAGTFYSFLMAVGVVTMVVYISGIPLHRTFQGNALISWSIISLSFFLFLLVGFYSGYKLKNTMSKPRGILNSENSSSGILTNGFDLPGIHISTDGLEEAVLSILLWIGILILGVILLIVFETIVWVATILAISFLHWIFYRAINYALQNSLQTKGSFYKSIRYSFYYTLIYTGWLFGIIYIYNLFI